TRPSVFERSLTTPRAASTRRSVMVRSLTVPALTTRPWVRGAGSAITTGSGNVHIGTFVTGFSGDETNTTRIRNIRLTLIVGGLPLVMEAFGPSGDGKLGIGSSSRRYKKDIKPMDKASERLFALKPVTFRAKANVESGHVKHYGFIAEDVAAVDSDLVVYN